VPESCFAEGVDYSYLLYETVVVEDLGPLTQSFQEPALKPLRIDLDFLQFLPATTVDEYDSLSIQDAPELL